MKNVLLWIALFLLIIFLLIPPALRLFGKDLYKNVKKEKDVLEVLQCTKLNETISETYLNGNAHNLLYSVKGNYENVDLSILEDSSIFKDMMYDIKGAATITYDETKDLTSFKVDLSSLNPLPGGLSKYTQKMNEQKIFYTNQKFSCTTQKY